MKWRANMRFFERKRVGSEINRLCPDLDGSAKNEIFRQYKQFIDETNKLTGTIARMEPLDPRTVHLIYLESVIKVYREDQAAAKRKPTSKASGTTSTNSFSLFDDNEIAKRLNTGSFSHPENKSSNTFTRNES